MKKITLYELTVYDEIKEVEAYTFIHPETTKQMYLVDVGGEIYSRTLEEITIWEFYLTKKEALKRIDDKKNKDIEFEKLCFDFIDSCEKYQTNNPFIHIGETKVAKDNLQFINEITDPVLRYFVETKIQKYWYVSDLESKLINKMKKH